MMKKTGVIITIIIVVALIIAVVFWLKKKKKTEPNQEPAPKLEKDSLPGMLMEDLNAPIPTQEDKEDMLADVVFEKAGMSSGGGGGGSFSEENDDPINPAPINPVIAPTINTETVQTKPNPLFPNANPGLPKINPLFPLPGAKKAMQMIKSKPLSPFGPLFKKPAEKMAQKSNLVKLAVNAQKAPLKLMKASVKAPVKAIKKLFKRR